MTARVRLLVHCLECGYAHYTDSPEDAQRLASEHNALYHARLGGLIPPPPALCACGHDRGQHAGATYGCETCPTGSCSGYRPAT